LAPVDVVPFVKTSVSRVASQEAVDRGV